MRMGPSLSSRVPLEYLNEAENKIGFPSTGGDQSALGESPPPSSVSHSHALRSHTNFYPHIYPASQGEASRPCRLGGHIYKVF